MNSLETMITKTVYTRNIKNMSEMRVTTENTPTTPMADAEASTENARPVSTLERVRLLDALRGFAILGILLANMLSFSGYVLLTPESATQLTTATADHIAVFLIDALVDGKFYSLFSFLFGVGFAIQLMRAEKRNDQFVSLFRRRLLILLFIGLAHAYLLWYGDILSIYALTGFLLIPFRGRTDRTLLLWAVILLAVPIILYALMIVLRIPDPYAAIGNAEGDPDLVRTINTFAHGGYFQIFKENLWGLAYRYADLLYTSRFPKVLGMFLLGFCAGRRGIFLQIENYLPLVRRVFKWGLAFGLIGNLALALLRTIGPDTPPSFTGLLQTIAYAVGVPSLCLFYIAALTLLWRRPGWQPRLSVLVPAGQMALSNYLLQTLICVTIFYGYGFGLFGRVGAALGTALGVLIFLIQLALSAWWLRRFDYGPVEWVWRQLTYRRRLPLHHRSLISYQE